MKKILVKLKQSIGFDYFSNPSLIANLSIKKMKIRSNQINETWCLVKDDNGNIEPLGILISNTKYLSINPNASEKDLYLEDDDFLVLSENADSFRVLSSSLVPNLGKGTYICLEIKTNLINLSNCEASQSEYNFVLKMYPNRTLFPKQSQYIPKIATNYKSGTVTNCYLKEENSVLKVFIDDNDNKVILGAITDDEFDNANIKDEIVASLQNGDEFTGYITCAHEFGTSHLVLHFSYSEKKLVENLPKSIINVINSGMISKEEGVCLYKKFTGYKMPSKMIDAIMSQWKDYGSELNKKIPSIEEAIFIDNPSEYYVRRCAGHILGNNNLYPRLRLVGHLSVGKDVLIRTLAALFHKPIDIVTIFSDTQKEDIFGAKTIAREGIIEYQPEPLIKAMENGTWIEFDEINTCDSGVLESLHKILDSEKAVNVTGYGRVKAKEGFGFFASMNPSDSNYNGTQFMNPSTQSRMKTIEIKKTKSIKDILTAKCPFASKENIIDCSFVYEKIRECVQEQALSEAFLGVRLYEDALDSACWMPIKDALIDVVAHADTNDSENVETVIELINATLE